MDRKIRIAGVPEHFNLPWHMAMEEGAFARRGIDLEWTDVLEGTGRMAAMLESGETDLAVILTEGIVKAIAGGTPALIAQEYISTPLLWGIHVHKDSPFYKEEDLKGAKAAISRFGSGSHLMAFVHAGQMGWPLDALKFEVVNTLEGAVIGMSSGKADYFMWERFTTQPLLDKGIFRRIGEIPTPWPCFVIAARTDFVKDHTGVLTDILEIINTCTLEFKDIPSIDRTLANRYHQKLHGIHQWLEITKWSQKQIDIQVLDNVISTLSEMNLLSKSITSNQLLFRPGNSANATT